MIEVLSLWRSPLDKVALTEAQALCDRGPRCSIGYGADFSAMTIYNYGYYISLGVLPDVALISMLAAMSPSSRGASGALAFIPQQSFPVHSSAAGYSVPDQSNILGSGGGGASWSSGGTPFFHFTITPLSGSASTFLTCNNASYTTGGVYFRSLAFQWGAGSTQADTCIYASMANVRAIRCTFTDCPSAFIAHGAACGLEQCTINYTVPGVTGPNGTKAVVLSGQQCAVLGPGVFSQVSQGGSAGGATGCTCISVEGAEHAIIADMQIYEWTVGVDFSQLAGALYTNITNCEIECWQNAIRIGLPGSGGASGGIKVTSCQLAKASDSTDADGIVKIDATGGTLYDVTLLDCTVFNMAPAPAGQHGLIITGGTNIKVIGGTYSNNGASGGAGIAITGGATEVQIIGANLQPNYPGALNANSQTYALLVTGTPIAGDVLVSSCDMTNYAGSPVHVVGTPSNLLITNCPGYNDAGTSLHALPVSLTTGVSASTSTIPYYGPSVIMYSNPAPVTLHIFGQSISSASGIVFLPSPYDLFSFSSVPISFTWIGK